MKNKALILTVSIVAAIAVLLALTAFVIKPVGLFGVKKVTVEINTGETVSEYTVKTKADNLADVLLDNDLVEGDIGEYGLYINAAGGYTADVANEEWWCIYQSGEMLMTGASDTPVANGDHFEVVLEVGYDF